MSVEIVTTIVSVIVGVIVIVGFLRHDVKGLESRQNDKFDDLKSRLGVIDHKIEKLEDAYVRHLETKH